MQNSFRHVISLSQLVYRRARRFLLAVLLIVVIEQTWTLLQHHHLQAMTQHHQQLMFYTLQQASYRALPLIIDAQPEAQQQFLGELLQHPYVAIAILYNRFGQPLAQHGEADPAQATTTLISEVRASDRIYGYLQIELARDALAAAAQKSHDQMRYFGQFLLAFALLAGLLIATAFRRRSGTAPIR